MKNLNPLFLFLLIIIGPVFSFSQTKINWTIENPGQTDVFVKNNGQFDESANASPGKVLFALNNFETVFFTKEGYTWRLDKEERAPLQKEEREEQERKIETSFVNMQWIGTDPNATVIAEEEAAGYYTYADEKLKSIRAKGYRKLIYKELYPGIDVEYIIPKKGGIKYSLIVKPGADVSKVKMKYTGDINKWELDDSGNIIIKTKTGDIIDHSPYSFQQNGTPVKSNFILKENNLIEFAFPMGYDTTKDLIVDPWTISPNLFSGKGCYDVDYDMYGNVYIDFTTSALNVQVSKYSPSGIFLWNISMASSLQTAYYSQFCVLPSGSVLIPAAAVTASVEAFAKVSASGTLSGIISWSTAALSNEAWVAGYNKCQNIFLIGGSGTINNSNIRVGVDTALAGTVTGINFTGVTGGYQDMASMVIDDNGDMYSFLLNGNNGAVNNRIYKSQPPYNSFVYNPLRTLSNVQELGTSIGIGLKTNRLNFMSVNSQYIYFFDGKNLEVRNKTTGALITYTIVSTSYVGGTGYLNEGIATDECGNIYVGGQQKVHVYNYNGTSLAKLPDISLPADTVYDIKVDEKNKLLYVTGKNFLSSISAPYGFSATQNSTCSSGTGFASVGGCSGSYTYLWSTGETTPSIIAPSGTYTVVITGATSCNVSAVQTLTITIAATVSTMSLTASILPIACNGGNTGSATVIVNGGNSPYRFEWSTGATTGTISNLVAGTYTVVVTDAGGCSNKTTFSITQSSPITTTINATTSTCGQASGTAIVFASGGTAPYSYLWSNGFTSNGSTSLTTGLSSQIYSVTVTDANGCTKTDNIQIGNFPGVNIQLVSSLSVTCNSACNGALIISASNGAAPYSFSWNNGKTNAGISNLCAGVYTTTVTDNSGCSSSSSFTIKEPSILSAVILSVDPSCNNSNDGSASVNASGGTPGYFYNWSNGATTAAIYNLSFTIYNCTVTDANGCTAAGSATVNQNSAISLTVTATNENCSQVDGTALASASGGVAPISYLWSNGATQASVVSLQAAVYSVTVTDVNGCSATASAIVNSVFGLSVTISPDVIINPGTSTTLSATGGGAYFWTPSGSLSCSTCKNPVASPTLTTTYYVTVTDSNGCTGMDSVIVSVEIICGDYFIPNAFSPNGDGENDVFCLYGINCIETMQLIIYDRWGAKVFETSDPADCWSGVFRNKKMDAAIFVYQLNLVLKNKGQINIKGNVSLIQ